MKRRDFLKATLVGAGVTAASLYGIDQLALLNLSSLSGPINDLLGNNSAQVPMLHTITATATSASTTTVTTTSTTSSTSVSGQMGDPLLIPHLLRRAGFGATPAELETYTNMGFDAAVTSLLNYQQVPDNFATNAPNIPLAYSDKQASGELQTLGEWWLNGMAMTSRPLQEKMTLFWHNHFATGFAKVENGYLMYQQNQFLRGNALGNFSDLLTGITADGAMLIWLDGVLNRKNSPNQNYAREVMEVFSTGRGPYTQNDVIAGAAAFTGYTIDSNGNGVFNPNLHDDSLKTFMGDTGNLGPSDILGILVPHPDTAANLATELFEFFCYPDPDPTTVTELAQVYLSSDYSISALVEAILRSPEFISEQAYLANVKSPVEYVATALRSLGATAVPATLENTTTNQGQQLFNPPTVFGWPSGMGWINTGSVMERFNFPLNIQTTPENSTSLLDPSQFFTESNSDDVAVAELCSLLFPDGIPIETLSIIQSSTHAVEDPILKTKNAVRLAMASPFYNLN